MEQLCFIVPLSCDGMLVKSFLRGRCGVSYRLMIRLKRVERGITMDGVPIRVIDRVCAGRTIVLRLPEDSSPAPAESELAVPVVYEDAHVLVVNKPDGMVVHPTRGYPYGTLAGAVAAHLAQKGEYAAFRPQSRLDRDTTGLILASKNAYAAALLSQKVDKEYVAVVHGVLAGSGTIDAPLVRKPGHSTMREVGEGGERAVTHWRVLASDGKNTVLSLRLETGRTHQIRCHFAAIGHPLIGDRMYGDPGETIDRQALHCKRIWFKHPVEKKLVTLDTALPADMQALVDEMTGGGIMDVSNNCALSACEAGYGEITGADTWPEI